MERHHLERYKLSGTAHRILQPVLKSFIISSASSKADSAAFSKDTELKIQMLWRMYCLSFQKNLVFLFFIWFVFSIPLPSFFASSSILGRGFAAGQVWLWYFGKKISSKCLKYTLVHLQNPKQNRCKLICNWNSGLGKFRKLVPLSRIAFLKQNSSGLPDCWLLRRKVWRAARGRQWVSGKWISGSSELQSWQAALSEEEVWES